MLSSGPEFVVVGEAQNGAEAIAQAVTLKPDVVVLDFGRKIADGIPTTLGVEMVARCNMGCCAASTIGRHRRTELDLEVAFQGVRPFLPRLPKLVLYGAGEFLAPMLTEGILLIGGQVREVVEDHLHHRNTGASSDRGDALLLGGLVVDVAVAAPSFGSDRTARQSSLPRFERSDEIHAHLPLDLGLRLLDHGPQRLQYLIHRQIAGGEGEGEGALHTRSRVSNWEY